MVCEGTPSAPSFCRPQADTLAMPSPQGAKISCAQQDFFGVPRLQRRAGRFTVAVLGLSETLRTKNFLLKEF
jgi:hypothetical protein